jgi:nicotinate-nucleotide pyrophosphorylase (carboxylating)
MAVITGGGTNHRFNLNEMVLIKDNHRLATQKEITLGAAISRARQMTKKKIEVEVDNIKQFHQAIAAKPDIILLDNMPPSQIRKAVKIKKLLKSSQFFHKILLSSILLKRQTQLLFL